MGRCRILSHRGGALYRATPVYDMTALDKELADLTAQTAEYAGVILRALNAIDALEDDAAVAKAALNAVIQQWIDGLIRDLNDAPPQLVPPEENDPITGLPWTDPADAQEAALLEALNAVRAGASVAALERDDLLDRAALNHLRDQATTKKSGHIGGGGTYPADRVLWAGYLAEKVSETLAYGCTSAAAVIAEWQKTASAIMTDADMQQAGVAYHYEPTYPATHMWCVVYAQPGTPPPQTLYGNDPATQKAEEQEAALNKIELPQTQTHQPKKLSEVAAAYSKAAQKLKAAQQDLARLYAERLARDQRMAELTALKAALNAAEIDVWCADFVETLTLGAEYGTFEVPGFYTETATHRVDTIYANTPGERQVDYWEQSINIAPGGTKYGPWGKLRMATNMTGAGVAWNLAMEAGHLRWKPWCRYGTITAIDGDTCTVVLAEAKERDLKVEERVGRGKPDTRLDLNPQATTLTGVTASYQGAGVSFFVVGDDVLIYFRDFDWAKPLIIGFRRVPRPFSGRQGWI